MSTRCGRILRGAGVRLLDGSLLRDRGRRLRRRQGLRRRLRPADARRLRRAGDQVIRPGEHERGDAARERHAQRARGALGRRAALRADPGDDRRRAARDLPVPRLLAPRRDDRPLQGHRRWCTATPIAAPTRAGRPAGRRSTTSPARSRSPPGVPTRSSRSDALASPAAAAYMGRKARTGHPWPAFP